MSSLVEATESGFNEAAAMPERVPRAQTATAVTLDSLTLDSGEVLAPVTLAYETWGRLAPAADNAILLCHALTGSAHARDAELPDDPRAGWWNPLIGPGRAFDTNHYFVICSNVLGGCNGSTGPTSPHPADDEPYRLRFPLVTVGDMVRAQHALLHHLGITRLAAVAGGSLGGMQALEWTLAYPGDVARAVVVGASAQLSAQGLAIDDIGRQAILSDPAWQDGSYAPGKGPATGLGIARMLALLTYTSPAGLAERFGRRAATQPSTWPSFGPRLDVETYLHHQADKLVRRFDANTYLYLSSAMDRYNATDGRGSEADTLARVQAEVLAVGISSDWLFPAAHVRALAEGIVAAGGRARYVEVQSLNGHDAFLKDWDQMEAILRPFLV
ncbi:MAG TPA: homoserine O-acetyltransferase [Ktedonobacterales bacterium]|nr:homoserine O-acetyltransferase [Ktedonobacterales bacterium]